MANRIINKYIILGFIIVGVILSLTCCSPVIEDNFNLNDQNNSVLPITYNLDGVIINNTKIWIYGGSNGNNNN